MIQHSSLAIVQAWQEAVNRRDIAQLLSFSHTAIELVGPRGSGRGHDLLRVWLERAGLELCTRRSFVRGGTVVLEQRGVWRSPETGEAMGERDFASHFEVAGRQVIKFARYDELPEALEKAGLH